MSEYLQLWSHFLDFLVVDVVSPTLNFLHLPSTDFPPREIAEASVYTIIQIFIIACIFRPLESFVPAEQWSDRRLTGIDRLYTLILMLGLLPLFMYLIFSPLLHLFGINISNAATTESPYTIKHIFPWFEHHQWALLAVYFVLYDLTFYWMHRAEHTIPWWWALHSMHHSQRQMSCWSSDREHYLSGLIQAFILAGVAVVVGINVAEFALLTLISELVQNLQHANVRFGFGRIFDKIIVGPKFHRLHHMVGDIRRPNLHNCNFGLVLPIWDILFGTALYNEPQHPTGVSDSIIDADNGRGLIAMQWYTLRRFWGAFRRPSGWRPGDVRFGPNYEPIRSDELSNRQNTKIQS